MHILKNNNSAFKQNQILHNQNYEILPYHAKWHSKRICHLGQIQASTADKGIKLQTLGHRTIAHSNMYRSLPFWITFGGRALTSEADAEEDRWKEE